MNTLPKTLRLQRGSFCTLCVEDKTVQKSFHAKCAKLKKRKARKNWL